MRSITVFALIAISMAMAAHGDEQKKEAPFEQLTYAELSKLDGTWEMKVDAKSGWKGVVTLYIMVQGPGGKMDRFCYMIYDATMDRNNERLFSKNAFGKGVTFAGVKQGQQFALVAPANPGRGPFEIKTSPELIAPYKLDGKKLTIDMSKSAKSFLPKRLAELEIDWSKTEWTRSDKVRGDK